MRLPRSSRPVNEYTAERARERVAQFGRAGRYAAVPAAVPAAPAADEPVPLPGPRSGRRRREVGVGPAGSGPGDEGVNRADAAVADVPGGTASRLDSVRDRLPLSLRAARVGLERRHVTVVGLVLLLGLMAATLFVGLGRPSVVPVDHEIVASGTPVASVPSVATEPAAGEEVPESSPTARMVVHVAGLVAEPGVVELPVGSRVIDAIDAAGGPTDEADLTPLNLARILNDGEQVLVTAEPPPVPPGSPEGGGSGGTDGVVNLNTATGADLESLPGIGPALAQRILDWRHRNGRFSSIDELREVSGIGEQRFAELESRVTV